LWDPKNFGFDLPPRYLSSLPISRETKEIKEANVTHVLSVLDYTLNPNRFKPFQHFAIKADDSYSENLLQYFAKSNQFIEDGLEKGRGVFVHW
jgi:dual specificity phosphatase 12